MKHFTKCVAVVFSVILFASCGTTKETVKVVTGAYERLDWQGRATGSGIPDWVVAVGDNNKREVVKKLDLDGYMVWSFNSNGTDLEFLQNWTDKVELQSNVAQSISSSIGRATEASMKAEQSIDETQRNKALKDVTTVLSNVRVNGLEKIASYWIKSRSSNVKNPKSDSDYETKYTYYSVWALKTDLYEKQINAAMKGLSENTAEDPLLMKLITSSIEKTILNDADAEILAYDAD
ncbi:hypothetical protein [Treponema sp.]|uniref:hypothetical protein n=1 Tax=Treponema sp. TaxID=166 RepID=UPI003F09ED22